MDYAFFTCFMYDSISLQITSPRGESDGQIVGTLAIHPWD